jgi:hypothetical protein
MKKSIKQIREDSVIPDLVNCASGKFRPHALNTWVQFASKKLRL